MRTVFFGLVVVAVVAAIAFAWSGVYDVAATEQETGPVSWLFAGLRDHSIARHSAAVVPHAIDDPSMIVAAIPQFEQMCSTCHGAPGQDRSAAGKGLNPSPPDLADDNLQRRYSDTELFWIVKHGIRRSGMPAFGDTQEDRAIWSMVAVVRRLPSLSAEEYATFAHMGTPTARQHLRRRPSDRIGG